MTTLSKARQAAKIAKKVLGRSITIKKIDGKTFAICIGCTDRDDDRVYRALAKKFGWQVLDMFELSADVSGYGVETVETV